MSPKHCASLVAPIVAILGVTTVATAFAQRVYAYSEPATCTTFFKPISGLTFHAGGAFNINWYIPSAQFGPVTYRGEPNPAISDDGTKQWTNPTANVTCIIDWYYLYPTQNMDASFRWHINFYGGTVSNCGGGGNVGGTSFTDVGMDPGYDPYGTYGPDGGSCGQSGTSGSPSGGGFVCHTEYVYIDVSYDGGITWEGWWEGEATVCES